MRQLVLVLLLAVAGSLTARAGFLYTFEQAGTGNILSFTVPDIITDTQDPLTQAIGQTVGSFTIADAAFGSIGGSTYCLAISSGSPVAVFSGGCGTAAPGMYALFTNPTAVGVYNMVGGNNVGGFPLLDRLTISETAEVPEPSTVAFIALGFAILAVRRKARERFGPSQLH